MTLEFLAGGLALACLILAIAYIAQFHLLRDARYERAYAETRQRDAEKARDEAYEKMNREGAKRALMEDQLQAFAKRVRPATRTRRGPLQ